MRFEAVGHDYMYAPYEDGNGNGVRTADIQAGIDRRLGPYPSRDAAEHWKEQFEARNEVWDAADAEWEGDA